MSGGERTKLHEVLVAKEALDLRVTDAYETVLQDLRARQKRDPATDTQILLKQAIATLEGLVASFTHQSAAAIPGAPKPASVAR
jgi:hypothetical protein